MSGRLTQTPNPHNVSETPDSSLFV
jgi:hypothetical protein